MGVSRFLAATALAAMALASVPTLALAQSVPAQSAPIAKADQPYFDLYDSIIGGLDLDQMANQGADAIFDGMARNNAEFAALAKSQPGLKGEFRSVAKPYLSIWVGRTFSMKRGRVAAKFKEHLNPAEARELAAFYGSPLGRKMLRAVGNNLSASNTVDSALKGRSGKVDQNAVRDDEADTVSAAMQDLIPNLTPAEQRQMLALGKTSAFRKLDGVAEAMQSVPDPAFNEIATQEEQKAFAEALGALFRKARARQ